MSTYCRTSRTGFFGLLRPLASREHVTVIAAGTAGTADIAVARAERTLRYTAASVAAVGVAGLWRLLNRLDEIHRHAIVIVAAGMDTALPTVIRLIGSSLVAVPTSLGYGVASGRRPALHVPGPMHPLCNIIRW
jgi:pyridinium-3,5-biscarboxylic acid mononucleotide synthase